MEVAFRTTTNVAPTSIRNNISFGEHSGTHFDAPIHWITGRDLPQRIDGHTAGKLLYRAGVRGGLLGRCRARR